MTLDFAAILPALLLAGLYLRSRRQNTALTVVLNRQKARARFFADWALREREARIDADRRFDELLVERNAFARESAERSWS